MAAGTITPAKADRATNHPSSSPWVAAALAADSVVVSAEVADSVVSAAVSQAAAVQAVAGKLVHGTNFFI